MRKEQQPGSNLLKWLAAGLALLIVVVFAQAKDFRFISLDDPQYVQNNPFVTAGLTVDGIRWAFTSTYAANWHPLTWISHMMDVELFGMNPGSHHVMNVALHAASSIVLLVTLARMTGSYWRSAFVAALFAVHPLHVESVAWVAERKDVLSTLFWMLTMHAYYRYTVRPGMTRYLLVIVFFVLGLMSKPMLVTLPFTLLLLDYWPLERIGSEGRARISAWIPLIREKLPMFALAAASAYITVVAQRSGGAVIALERLSPAERIANASVAVAQYMRDMILPRRLAVFYPFLSASTAAVVLASLLLLGFTVFAVWYGRRYRFLIVGWLWYLGTLVPVIGIVQAGAQGRADRYTYVPLIGLFIVLAWGVPQLLSRWTSARTALAMTGAAIVAACALLAHRQAGYWKNSLLLWSRAVAVTSKNYRAHDQLGVALSDAGRTAEAVAQYQASLDVWPDYHAARNNLGTARMEQQQYDEAVKEFTEAARLRPSSPTFRYNLAVALDAAGRRSEALAQLDTGLTVNPQHADLLRAWTTLGGPPRK